MYRPMYLAGSTGIDDDFRYFQRFRHHSAYFLVIWPTRALTSKLITWKQFAICLMDRHDSVIASPEIICKHKCLSRNSLRSR